MTIFGSSAGAHAVATLLAVPAARGLFARAISESTTTGLVRSADDAATFAAQLAALLGARPQDGTGGELLALGHRMINHLLRPVQCEGRDVIADVEIKGVVSTIKRTVSFGCCIPHTYIVLSGTRDVDLLTATLRINGGGAARMGELDGKVAFITGAGCAHGWSHPGRQASGRADVTSLSIRADIDSMDYPNATASELDDTAQLVEAPRRPIVAHTWPRVGWLTCSRLRPG